jgi:hypothetical protein
MKSLRVYSSLADLDRIKLLEQLKVVLRSLATLERVPQHR